MNYPVRKVNRLSGFDYSSPNIYFVTICTLEKRCILWSHSPDSVGATNGRPPCSHLSPAGMHVHNAIGAISLIYPAVSVINYVIMPNHIHLLLHIHGDESGRPMVAPTVSRVIAQIKGLPSRHTVSLCGKKASTITLSGTRQRCKAYGHTLMEIPMPGSRIASIDRNNFSDLFHNPIKWVY